MRFIIYILLSLLIVSCGTTKNIFKPKKDKIEFEDRDADNVLDAFDLDTVAIVDSDGDGIIDSEDACPRTFGLPENRGCPEIAMYAPMDYKTLVFNLVLVKDMNDFLAKNPNVDEETIEFIKRVYNLDNSPRKYNRQIIESMFDSGTITKAEFDKYYKEINTGKAYFEINQKPTAKSNYIPNVENMDIVDNTNDDNNSKGTIAYSVPNEMQVGKQYVIKLRITKEKGKEVNQTLVLGDRNIPISDVNIDSKVTIENIRVEKTMTAQLISEDGNFKVTPQNTDKQIIEDNEYTEWGWIVTPLKSGRTYLKLIIKIKIDTDGEVTYKDIVVFDKDIQVKANATFEVKNWLAEYWQWLMTTIIIPLVVWFFKRKKKGEEEEKEESEE